MQTKEKFILSAEQSALIAELERQQRQLGKSDGEFCRDHLSYSPTVWSRVKSGDYWTMVSDPESVLIQLALDLKNLERDLAYAQRHAAQEFREFDDFAAVLKAIRQCRAKDLADPDRLVVFLADTGGGKSALCAHVAREFNGVVVEAREGWTRSYFTCLRDIADALGVNAAKIFSKTTLEDEILRKLTSRRRVLAIDEAEFFGVGALNLVKLILNKTPTVILLCAIGEAYDRWNRSLWHEAAQVRRRTDTLIRQSVIRPKEVKPFLKECGLNGCLEEAANCVAQAANEFGRFNTVRTLARKLTGQAADLDDVISAVRLHKQKLGFPVGK